ncbi:MAG: zinc finger Ran-binding domain-containing protein [Anaerosomatales bacterium]|nr:zinc finger Ran-binding domain-containing protein [Anaerosomatales bacterium]
MATGGGGSGGRAPRAKAVGLGLIAPAAGALVRWATLNGAINEYRAWASGDNPLISDYTQGIFGTMVGAAFFLLLAMLGVVIAVYVGREVIPGIVTGVGAGVLYALAGTLYTVRLERLAVPADVVARVGVVATWLGALGLMIVPTAIGVVLGTIAARARSNREERSDWAPVPVTEGRPSVAQLQMARGAGAEDEPVEDAAPHAAPATVAAEERRAMRCAKCGASNAPFRTSCIACGRPLG